jgi:Na+-translocating ferredoxin:NAD+ oxidoreductase subunit B
MATVFSERTVIVGRVARAGNRRRLPYIAAPKTGKIRGVTTPSLHALAVARIDEATCIGCTLCIDACPFDAIVGAAKRMHSVLPALCTGCALCVPPCPVDCIAMVPAGRAWSREDARAADERKAARNVRIAQSGAPAPARASPDDERDRRRAAVAAALVRARARRLTFGSGRK